MGLVVDEVVDAREHGRKVILVGNGGSASVVGHLQMDLCNAVKVQAVRFHDAPLLTALANDHGYASAFERGVRLWASRSDLLIAISSSGSSPNILRAVDAAAEHGCRIITLTGFLPENPLRQRGDLNLYVPSAEYGPVETVHACLAHMLTDIAVSARSATRVE